MSPQDTSDMLLGSGALSYPWYRNVVVDRWDEANNLIQLRDVDTTVAAWTLRFQSSSRGPRMYVVTHGDCLRAAHRIADAEVSAGSECEANCTHLISGRIDDVDFDANTADQVIQVAAFGEVIYG